MEFYRPLAQPQLAGQLPGRPCRWLLQQSWIR